jgi:C_GCAxxG_C_C family probable redox protein
MTKKADFVDDQFSKYSCSQTVLSLFAQELDLDEKTALKIASGFGGGMACAETCGAATGAYMVIGMKHGHTSTDPVEKSYTKLLIQKFNKAFEEEHQSLICKKLIGFDISKQDELEEARKADVFHNLCPSFIKSACDILEKDF